MSSQTEKMLSQFTQFINGEHPNDEQFVKDLKSFMKEILEQRK